MRNREWRGDHAYKTPKNLFHILTFLASLSVISCVTNAISAEEYYNIGMAYFDIGKYAEAETWLNKARSARKTMTASDYNLGRIAFETKRYKEAEEYFERVLKKDSNNIQALKAVAYTCIKLGNFDKAESLYNKVLALVPESVDDGYNYALVLYAVEKYPQAEEVLVKYPTLLENNDTLLLYARCQKAQSKPEAIDNFIKYLEIKDDANVRYEYAESLEQASLYARALEEYRTTYEALPQESIAPAKSTVRFVIARVLLLADSDNDEGIEELKGALIDGFDDFDAVKALLTENIPESRKIEIQALLDNPPKAEDASAEAEDLATETEDISTETPLTLESTSAADPDAGTDADADS
ncbi:MAG: tetratricopeptide repeat protein [Treponema sp.]|jgi:tetratricopeptide (TPR) repeat protein|nr:tetratricopeptide repeat protein [Treponema sp.]